jgi:threonine 3-dehydrogenase
MLPHSLSRCLVTGGNGNLAVPLVAHLAQSGSAVLVFDAAPPAHRLPEVEYVVGDIRDSELVRSLFQRHRPTQVVHLAAILSGRSEQDRRAAWAVNATATFELFECSLEFQASGFFLPSTGATYGTGLPEPLPESQPQWPENLYGATKVAAERLGVYYARKHGLDFRGVRLPLVISRHAPAAAVSAYASHAFLAAAAGRPFEFPVPPTAAISSIYVKDVVAGMARLIAAPRAEVRQPMYNLHSFSPSAADLAAAIAQRVPGFRWEFRPQPEIARLIAGWAKVNDDAAARRDWGWAPQFDLARTADDLLAELKTAPGAGP